MGRIVLNHTVGGLNPETVEKAIKLGTKIVWMPSMDAALTIEKLRVTYETTWLEGFVKRRDPKEGISIFKDGVTENEIRSEVKDILKLIAEADVTLDTCHLGAGETLALVKEAKKNRSRKNYHLPPELQRQSDADRRAARTGQTGSSIELCTVALHAAVRQAGF